ncbi:MAG: hypothetical protein P4K83_02190 [Terracidiphilus sp.]|nr:hypothetical protein [Terracidiphilus sp.]
MDTKQKWEITGGIFLVLCLTVGAFTWLQQHDAALKAQGTSATAEAKAQDQTALRQQLAETQAKYDQAIAAQQAAVKTPQQAAQVIDHYIQVPDKSQTVIVSKAQMPAVVQAELPDAPSYAVQTEQKSEATAKQLLGCDQAQHDLGTCEQEKASLQTELQVMTADRDNWRNTAKGGTWWHRTLTAAKWVGVGAAIGVAAGYAASR